MRQTIEPTARWNSHSSQRKVNQISLQDLFVVISLKVRLGGNSDILQHDLKGQSMHADTLPSTDWALQENLSLDIISEASQCMSMIKEPVLVLPSINWAQMEELVLRCDLNACPW